MDKLEGRVALVTGASRGIGRAIAIALAEAGADIGVNFRERREHAEEVAAQIQRLGRKAAVLQADVSQADSARKLVKETTAELGSIGILVNNAGIARVQKPEDTREEDWDEIVTANLKSCFLVTQAVLPGMREQGWGRIINLSSVAAHIGGIVGAHYAASKAGMLGLTHYYASALVKEGITVNAISPALIETDMVTANLNAKPDRIPVGRFGRVEEVSDIAVMLAGNGFITGQTIHVNGGLFMS
jgi:3-oxoacyl-[acyl-carrier protein] reductase